STATTGNILEPAINCGACCVATIENCLIAIQYGVNRTSPTGNVLLPTINDRAINTSAIKNSL
ncbi:hypothetical protein PU35_25180, partial [Escherichia coli]